MKSGGNQPADIRGIHRRKTVCIPNLSCDNGSIHYDIRATKITRSIHIRKIIPDVDEEHMNKLATAIDRLIKFSENDGVVDFLLPPQIDEQTDDQDENSSAVVDGLRQLVQDCRSEVRKRKLPTYIENEKRNEDDD